MVDGLWWGWPMTLAGQCASLYDPQMTLSLTLNPIWPPKNTLTVVPERLKHFTRFLEITCNYSRKIFRKDWHIFWILRGPKMCQSFRDNCTWFLNAGVFQNCTNVRPWMTSILILSALSELLCLKVQKQISFDEIFRRNFHFQWIFMIFKK